MNMRTGSILRARARRAQLSTLAVSVMTALATLVALAQPALAQDAVDISGVVGDPQGLVLPGVSIELRTPAGALVASTTSDGQGQFALRVNTPGQYVIAARLLGFTTYSQPVDARQAVDDLRITLDVGAFEQEVVVTASMPEVETVAILPAGQMERRAAQDVAGYLRSEPGIGAVRRGSINLEPTVRGLYEAQMGVFVDGTRTFAAGPARMDSELSHVSPHMLQSVQLVKGPYALTWGNGTLSSLRASTFRPQFTGAVFSVGGRASVNYGSNADSLDGFAGLWGSNDRVRFALLHNTRTGGDYSDGDGQTVPGDYESFDTRWDVGLRVTPEIRIEYTGGHQHQRDLDYPGRILDATLFSTYSHAAEASWRPGTGTIGEVYGHVYANLKDHAMNNDAKPTARPAAGRVPPFGIRVELPASSDAVGGSGYVVGRRDAWQWKLGGDVYRLTQSATRTIFRRSNGAQLFQDAVWPDATLTNGGGYGQLVYEEGAIRLGGTVRLDSLRASATETSTFFLENTEGALSANETHLSAAVNANLLVQSGWTLTLGAGRAVRAPDALERYSDRFPAAQFQTAAEFMGNPQLRAERSFEFNAGSIVSAGPAVIRGDLFYRTIDDYITVSPDSDLSRRLPLSPPQVFRYVNGTSARFTGYELKVESDAGRYADVSADWSYLWAEDELFDEPVFGITPFEQRYAVELHTMDGQRWVELSVTSVARQERVAVARLERVTDGWTTVDLRAGVAVGSGVTVRAGIENLTDTTYATHLNTLDPFTGQRIGEIGRRGYMGLEYAF